MKKYIFLIFLFSILLWETGNSQEVPQSVSNTGIYEFLDELANIHIIEINSVVKPYSRLYISKKLQEAEEKSEQLNSRQRKELEFYLKDFLKELNDPRRTTQDARGKTIDEGTKGRRDEETEGRRDEETKRRWDEETGNTEGVNWIKGGNVLLSNGTTIKRRMDVVFYQDSLFQLTVNPILGGEVFNNASGKATYWRNGIEARGYIKHWGFYASLRDNHQKPLLGSPDFLTKSEGGNVKNNTDWSEMQGGVTYSWKWGNAGLVKDGLQWGNNYNGSNIFSGHNPTFVQLRLNINPAKWFSFSYFHGWLNSKVVDSTISYWVTNSYGTDYREVYHKKFIAANMFTFTPFRNLNISAGNSIVYSDNAINPAYLIPLFFYKSVDHSQTLGIDNMNSQMFFDVSSRQIKNLHLYVSMFIDELSVSRFAKNDEWNFFSWKAGFRLTDLPVDNLSFTTEFTYTYPLTFQHYVPTLTFENAGYNMGHYLKDNSREWYFAFDYRPMRTLDINLFFSDAIRGPDYTELGTNRLGNPPLASVEWHNTSYGLKASYQVINDLYTWASYISSDIGGDVRYSPEFYYGRKNTVNVGVTIGF